MTNMLADAATWLADQQQAHLATEITYRRGGADLTISATRGASGHQVDQTTGIFSWFDQDWLIPASVLTIGVPLRHDEIIVGSETYKVLPPNGEECWRWSDHNNTIYRIHSERVKE
jgi:hypothetical protein